MNPNKSNEDSEIEIFRIQKKIYTPQLKDV